MNHLLRAMLLLVVAGIGFLAGSIMHPGATASGLRTAGLAGLAKPCANATPTARPSSARVGVGSYKGWSVTVTRFALHKPGDLEPTPAGDALYVLHVIVDNRGTQTWLLYGNQFALEDVHTHEVYSGEPLSIFPDVHGLALESIAPGTKIERDVAKFAPAHAQFRLRVHLPQLAGSPDLVITLPPLQPAS